MKLNMVCWYFKTYLNEMNLKSDVKPIRSILVVVSGRLYRKQWNCRELIFIKEL